MRTAVGLFDQSSFAKFLVRGPDAESVLQRICANDVGGAPGRVVYTQWLNEQGGIEADLTVTRLAEDALHGRDRGRDRDAATWLWLKTHIPPTRAPPSKTSPRPTPCSASWARTAARCCRS